jgi:hypothetical protein
MRRQQRVARPDRPGEHLLAQQRPVVRPVGLLADDHQFTVEVQFAHTFGGPEARAPGSDDDNALARTHR